MKASKKLILLFLLSAALAATVSMKHEPTRMEKLTVPVRHLENFRFDPQGALDQRVTNAPGFVLDYLMEFDQRKDYAAYQPTAAEMKTIRETIGQLPPALKSALRERLVAIYFVSNLRGNGFTDFTMDRDRRMYLFMVFNPRSLQSDISSVLTGRELTCFKNDDPALSVSITAGAGRPGLLYILLHESAHGYDYLNHVTPYVEPGIPGAPKFTPAEKPFTRGVWKAYSEPLAESDFALRKKVAFYGLAGGPKLKISQTQEAYSQLGQSPFVSLYGSQNWAEDFADSLAFYHLTQKMNLPYKIILSRPGAQDIIYEPEQNPKVRLRFGLLETFYH